MEVLLMSFFSLFAFYLIYFLFPVAIRFRFQHLHGLLLNGIIFFAGIFLTYHDDIRHDTRWFGNFYTDSSLLVLKIAEPPVEKGRSFKTTATVEYIQQNTGLQKVSGKVIVYFSKEEGSILPAYGDRILIRGGLQRIRNSGNPGAFDYERYMCFQQTFHQLFLKRNGYTFLTGARKNPVYRFVFFSEKGIVNMLKENIRGDEKVTGIAEALLIGYKEDLDKDEVQAYSNTGVVHIIAISGMHLGLIYAVLVWLFSRIPFIKRSAVTKVILVLSCLWLFSLITGASASVLRSAVMFTCIITGKTFFRQAAVYNSLAASAFLLLCYDPFLLWDVGFQLSYFAVIGIVWLQRPLFSLIYCKHTRLQKIWEMCAVTLSAQVLTLPVCIYYFHQLPTTFLITNIICVPLSTVILFAEIFLIGTAAIPFIASALGKCAYLLTRLMNLVIDTCNNLPYSLVDNMYSTVLTTWLLYGFIIFLCSGLLRRKKMPLLLSGACLTVFIGAWAFGKTRMLQQKKIIIYNVSRHCAVDFIAGNNYCFYGDSAFYTDGALQNFHLKPARISFCADERKVELPGLFHNGRFWQFGTKKLMIIDSAVQFESTVQKLTPDILLISGNPKMSITDITSAITPSCIVFDASNSLWKIGQWKKECEQLHLRCHNVAEQGAFISDVR